VTTVIGIAVDQTVAGQVWDLAADMGKGLDGGRLVDRGRGTTFGFMDFRMGWMGLSETWTIIVGRTQTIAMNTGVPITFLTRWRKFTGMVSGAGTNEALTC